MKALDELTTRCIRCGFCLESCPTFLETGNEMESPRGRIYLVRSAEEGLLDYVADVKPHLDLCLGCRACEPACPSGVQYGEILEIARDKIESRKPDRAQAFLLDSTTRPWLLRTQLAVGNLLPGTRVPGPLARALSDDPPEADKPHAQQLADLPALVEAELPPVRGEVFLLEGCAMRVLFPRVHQATRRLLRRAGYQVREVSQGCCGALDAHNGRLERAQDLARSLATKFKGDLPIVVNSAGCGSTMKAYGELIGDADFASRTQDVSEFLMTAGFDAMLAKSRGLDLTATYHDACHLAHGQRITTEPRRLIKAIPNLRFVPLPEADLCCGSAGIYNLTQPKMARQLVERKYRNIAETGASIVVTGNPGCHAWIAQAAREHGQAVRVFHTMELLEAAFSGIEPYLK